MKQANANKRLAVRRAQYDALPATVKATRKRPGSTQR